MANFEPQRLDDGYLEVIGFTTASLVSADSLPFLRSIDVIFFRLFNGPLGDQSSEKVLDHEISRIGTHVGGHDESDLLFAIAEGMLL